MAYQTQNMNKSSLKISTYKRFTEEARFYARRYSTVTMTSLYNKFTSHRSSKKRNTILEQMRLEWQSQYGNGILKTEDEISDEKLLAKATFRFYLHQINPDTKTRDHLLYDMAFELQHLLNGGKPDEKRFLTLITAATQSGKTFLAIGLMNIMLSLGYVPCFIVMNLKQKSQLFKRYINDTIQLKNYLLSEGFFGKKLDIFEEPIFYDSSNHDTFSADLQSCLNGSARRTVICIHHEKHLTNILGYMTPDSNIILFIDEAHKLGGYKKMSISGDGDDLHGTAIYDNTLQELKHHAQKIYLITATPQDILLTDPNLYAYGIVYIPEGTQYQGIPCWKFDLICEKTKNSDELMAEVNENGKGKIIGIPEPFMKMMKNLSHKDPIKRTDKFGKKGYHPINVLARYQPINELQHMTLSSFRSDTKPANDDHKEIIDSDWTVMVFNQYGVRLFHQSIRGETITIGEETIKDYIGNGEFLFKHADLGEVWNWLAHHGGVERFPRLVTIAYNNASEGISYCSTWTNEPDTDASWHITHGYIRLGTSASSAMMEQAMGRMNGNFGDTIIPTITCTLDEKQRCIKGHLLHYKWIKALSELALHKKDVRVIDFITKDPLFTNHIPRSFSGIPKAVKQLKRKPNPHKKMEEDSFKKYRNAISTMEILAPEHFDKDESRRKRNIERCEKDNEMNKSNGNTYRLVVPEKIKTDTDMMKIYKKTVEFILDKYGTSVWVNRTHVIKHIGGNEQSIKGTLTHIYQKKTTMNGVSCNSPGLVMKKEDNDVIQLCLN